MPRETTTEQDDQLASNATGFILFVQLDIDPVQRFCTGADNYPWDGHTWLGTGALASIEEIKEQNTLETTAIRLGLSGAVPENVAIALDVQMQGKPARIWFGILDKNHRLIGNPIVEFAGYVDVPSIVDDRPSRLSIFVNIETRLARMLAKKVWRFTDADQQLLYPNDKYYEFMPQMQEKVLAWGKRYGQ